MVAAEPCAGVLETNIAAAAELVRLASELGHVLCVAPATRDDVLRGTDLDRRRQRLEELRKSSGAERASTALAERQLLDISRAESHPELVVDRRVPSPVQPEPLWRCPECGWEKNSVSRPDPCPDHPFDEMELAGANPQS